MRNLIMASENKLTILEQDRQINIDEIVLETTIVKAGKQLEDRLKRFIMYSETQ